MTDSSRAASRAVRASGPVQSSDADSGITPSVGTRPQVGFSPTSPHIAPGCRKEPPVSVPSEPATRRAATATPEPDDEPPGTWAGFHGLSAWPLCSL